MPNGSTLRLLAASVALSMTVPAMAQTKAAAPTAPTAPVDPAAERAKTLGAIHETARCLAGNKAAAVRGLFATKPQSEQEVAAFEKIFEKEEQRCVRGGSSMVIDRPLMRGALAEAMYRSGAARGLTVRPIQASTYTSLVKQGAMPAPKTYMAAFTDCVAAARPAEVHALVTTTNIDSREEKAAMRGIVDTFSACLPSGQQVKLDPLTVRVALAESIYTLDQRARQPAAAPTPPANGTK